MVIAVEHGLEQISNMLRQLGYTIVSCPDYGGVVDAFIYKENIADHLEDEPKLSQVNSIDNYNSINPHGVLIINANNKSIKQIEEILKNRIYSPLF